MIYFKQLIILFQIIKSNNFWTYSYCCLCKNGLTSGDEVRLPYLIEKRKRIDEVFIEAQFISFETKGQSQQLGEVDNGEVKTLFELLLNLFLAGIQVDMAKGTGHNDRGKAFLFMTQRTL
jgi:hypothetical protein